MLQYYVLTNVIIALFFLIEIQRAMKWGLKEGFGEFIGVLVITILIVVPWITYSCGTFVECFK